MQDSGEFRVDEFFKWVQKRTKAPDEKPDTTLPQPDTAFAGDACDAEDVDDTDSTPTPGAQHGTPKQNDPVQPRADL